MSRVIRYRNYDMANNFNDYRREMVLLHIPFRSEDNEVLAENKFIQIYEDNKNLILERRKEFECNLDLEKTLEICRQVGRDDDNEDEQLRNEANVIFEEDPYARLLQDVNSVVNANIRNATLSKIGAIAKKRENTMDTQQFYDLMRSANSEQKELLMHIISHLQTQNQQPFQVPYL